LHIAFNVFINSLIKSPIFLNILTLSDVDLMNAYALDTKLKYVDEKIRILATVKT